MFSSLWSIIIPFSRAIHGAIDKYWTSGLLTCFFSRCLTLARLGLFGCTPQMDCTARDGEPPVIPASVEAQTSNRWHAVMFSDSTCYSGSGKSIALQTWCIITHKTCSKKTNWSFFALFICGFSVPISFPRKSDFFPTGTCLSRTHAVHKLDLT